MKVTAKIIILTLCAALFFQSCQDDPEQGREPEVNRDQEILSFGFETACNAELPEDVSGTIEAFSIFLTVPAGTDLTGLKASFTFIGDSVTVGGLAQTSGETINDFTNSVIYIVNGEFDSSSYTVNVNSADAR